MRDSSITSSFEFPQELFDNGSHINHSSRYCGLHFVGIIAHFGQNIKESSVEKEVYNASPCTPLLGVVKCLTQCGVFCWACLFVCWLVCFVLLCFALFCFVCLFVCFPTSSFFLDRSDFQRNINRDLVIAYFFNLD